MHLLFGSGKKVVSVHVLPASFVGSLVGARFWLPLAALYLRWFYGRADMLFAVSGTVAHELKTTLKLGKKRIETFYNTVNMQHYASTPDERVAARKKLGIAEDATLVLGNGQVQPRKRLDTFYETAELLPDVQFIWIGGIPFKRLGADYGEMNHLMEHPPKNAVSYTHLSGAEHHPSHVTREPPKYRIIQMRERAALSLCDKLHERQSRCLHSRTLRAYFSLGFSRD